MTGVWVWLKAGSGLRSGTHWTEGNSRLSVMRCLRHCQWKAPNTIAGLGLHQPRPACSDAQSSGSELRAHMTDSGASVMAPRSRNSAVQVVLLGSGDIAAGGDTMVAAVAVLSVPPYEDRC